MAKRFNILKEFGRSTKKPKLDMTINKVPKPSLAVTAKTKVPAVPKRKTAHLENLNSDSLWDDEDDDDVILLATQVAESQVIAACEKTIPPTNSSSTENDVTFSEFLPKGADSAATSTQILQMEFALSNADALTEDAHKNFVANRPSQANPRAHNSLEQLFKKPANRLPTQPIPTQNIIFTDSESLNVSQMDQVAGSPSEARRQLASERQMKFLMERVNVLKNENAKLASDLNETKSRVTSKEGEASLLRDELRHIKQQIQQLKMQKLFSAETVETKCRTKIAELNKQMEATQTELQFKVVECIKLRQADESKRLDCTIRDTSIIDSVTDTGESNIKVRWMRLQSDCTTPVYADCLTSTTHLNELIFEPSIEKSITQRQQRSVFQTELETMQTITAQLHLHEMNTLKNRELNSYLAKIMTSVQKVFPEFWSYVHSLEYPKNCRVHPYHDYNLISDLSNRTKFSLYQTDLLYPEERAVRLRRYIVTLAVILHRKQLPVLFPALLCAKHNGFPLLQICIDAIQRLGYSREICEHFGLVESLAKFLHGLFLNITNQIKQNQADLIFGILKHIIFIRPTPWIFADISLCCLECTRHPIILNMFCCNCSSNHFRTDRVRSVYHFTDESCLLQVYAGLLEIAFPMHSALPEKHFDLLITITENHVRFVYNCFATPPKFIHNNLPSYDEDEEDSVLNGTSADRKPYSKSSCSTHSNSASCEVSLGNEATSTSTNCECYTKLCLSVVTLVFQLLRQWMYTEKQKNTLQIANISKIAVQLLHIIFCDNYITRLFHDEEETTKHHLSMIYTWWKENIDLLQFSDIQKNFLNKLRTSHIMPKQLHEEENKPNISMDMKEWYRVSNEPARDHTAVEELKFKNFGGNIGTFFEGLNGYSFDFQ